MAAMRALVHFVFGCASIALFASSCVSKGDTNVNNTAGSGGAADAGADADASAGTGGAGGGAATGGLGTGGTGGVAEASVDSAGADAALDAPGDGSADGGSDASTLGCIAQVSAGGQGTCARKTDGSVWCWGSNRYGELGNGTTLGQLCGTYLCDPTPGKVTALATSVANVSAGFGGSACAVKTDGSVWCWGRNEQGQLGDGTKGDPGCPGATCKGVPVQVTAMTNADAAEVGGVQACAHKKDGTVWCWGNNGSGELGDGTLVGKTTPVEVTSLGNVVDSITGAIDSACARKTDRTWWCWGRNDFGQIGDGSVSPAKTPPVQLSGMSQAKGIAPGMFFACGVRADGSAWCWGQNETGQLGDGTITGQLCSGLKCKPTPVQVGSLGTTVAQVTAGLYHACARKQDGTVWCWGENRHGQLGDGTTSGQVCGSTICNPTPVKVVGIPSAVDVDAGSLHTCMREANGNVWCWGANDMGQLGDGTAAGQQCSGVVCKPTAVTVKIPCP